jgi:hypothetical protein
LEKTFKKGGKQVEIMEADSDDLRPTGRFESKD